MAKDEAGRLDHGAQRNINKVAALADEKIDALSKSLVEKRIFELHEVYWAMGEQGKVALRIKRAQTEAYEHRRGRSRSSDRGSVVSEDSGCEYSIGEMMFQLGEGDIE